MSQMAGQETQPSPGDGDQAMARLDRLLTHLRAAEARLRNLSRENMAPLGESISAAAEELRALRGTLRPGASCRLPQEPLQARMMELIPLSRRVRTLFDAARSFHAALLKMHQTEQHGYSGLVDVPGARNLATFPHRMEMRG